MGHKCGSMIYFAVMERETLTSHTRSTRATESCGQWRSSLRGAVRQFAHLLVERIGPDAGTWRINEVIESDSEMKRWTLLELCCGKAWYTAIASERRPWNGFGQLWKHRANRWWNRNLKGRKRWRPSPLMRIGPSGCSSASFILLKHVARYCPCCEATWQGKNKIVKNFGHKECAKSNWLLENCRIG